MNGRTESLREGRREQGFRGVREGDCREEYRLREVFAKEMFGSVLYLKVIDIHILTGMESDGGTMLSNLLCVLEYFQHVYNMPLCVVLLS